MDSHFIRIITLQSVSTLQQLLVRAVSNRSSDKSGTVRYHVFQIAKPHTGSTLLNCILQGLLDRPYEKYSYLPSQKPGDNGKPAPWPLNANQTHAHPYPFIWHDGRLLTAQDHLGVTTVTKTHVVDVDRLHKYFGALFDHMLYVAANRADKKLSIRKDYCDLDYVLCVDYDDFSYTPGTLDEIADSVQRVKSKLEDKFPVLVDTEMDVQEAVERVKLMEKSAESMADKSVEEHELYFGIHGGGHRNHEVLVSTCSLILFPAASSIVNSYFVVLFQCKQLSVRLFDFLP